MDELHGEAAASDGFARLDHMQFTALGQTRNAVVELILEQLDGHAAAVNRRAELTQQVGQAADVILVAVGDEDAAHTVAVLEHVGEIRNHRVHARHGFIREDLAAIDDDDVVAVFVGRHVLADFAHAAQRNHAQGRAAGVFAGAGAHRRRLFADPLQRLGDAGLLLQGDRRDDAAAHARLRALGLTGVRAARAFRLGIVAYALARRIAARLRGLGGLLRRSRIRAACVSGCGGRLRLSGTDAVIRPRRARRLSGLRLIAAGRRRGRLLARRFARHARAARLGGLLRLVRRLFGGLRLRARLARRGVRRLRLALGGRLGVSARRRTAARRAVSVLAVLGIGIAALILIWLVQVFVFVFCHKNFLSFSARGFARAASNRRFDASAFGDLISLPCRRRSSRRSTSILSEAGIRRRAKIHNIFIIHENLSYRNKNRLIRSISRFPRPFT